MWQNEPLGTEKLEKLCIFCFIMFCSFLSTLFGIPGKLQFSAFGEAEGQGWHQLLANTKSSKGREFFPLTLTGKTRGETQFFLSFSSCQLALDVQPVVTNV